MALWRIETLKMPTSKMSVRCNHSTVIPSHKDWATDLLIGSGNIKPNDSKFLELPNTPTGQISQLPDRPIGQTTSKQAYRTD
jgi:hypothetical protein